MTGQQALEQALQVHNQNIEHLKSYHLVDEQHVETNLFAVANDLGIKNEKLIEKMKKAGDSVTTSQKVFSIPLDAVKVQENMIAVFDD